MKRSITLSIISIFLSAFFGFAQPGTLDGDFDADGTLILDYSGFLRLGVDVAVQPDGKILVAGNTQTGPNSGMYVARLNPDGSFDNSFGSNGIASPATTGADVLCQVVVLQPDGKILLGGTTVDAGYFFTVVRLDANGNMDSSFGTNGESVFSMGAGLQILYDMALQTDGKIVVAGSFNGTDIDAAVARLNSDGSFDFTFSYDGKVTTDAGGQDDIKALAIDQNGKILIGGRSQSHSLLIRYNSDGTLDNTFGTNGKLITEFSTSSDEIIDLVLDGAGNILIAGSSFSGSTFDFLVARYNPVGILDNTFSFDGIVHSDFSVSTDKAKCILIQPDNKVLVAGEASDGNRMFALARYNADGSLDNSFNSSGKVTTALGTSAYIDGLALQGDGKIVVAGTMFDTDYHPAAARYISGINISIGEVDAYIGSTLVYPNPIINNQVTVEYELKSDDQISIDLFDISGKWMAQLQPNRNESAGAYQKTLNIPSLSAGNYLLKLNTLNGSVSVKVTVN